MYHSKLTFNIFTAVRLGVFSGPGGTGTSFYKPTGELFLKSKQAWVKPVEGITHWQGMPE